MTPYFGIFTKMTTYFGIFACIFTQNAKIVTFLPLPKAKNHALKPNDPYNLRFALTERPLF
jgi:hypothetical protein